MRYEILLFLMTLLMDITNGYPQGYKYTTPQVPFTLPRKTTLQGYDYPTPKNKLTLPPRRTTPKPEGYEYPVPSNPLTLPKRGRSFKSNSLSGGNNNNYQTCEEMARLRKIFPLPGVNCLHVPKKGTISVEDTLELATEESQISPLLRNIPADIVNEFLNK